LKEYYQEDRIKSINKKAAKIRGKPPLQQVSGLFPGVEQLGHGVD
jgi:hypothetical protein